MTEPVASPSTERREQLAPIGDDFASAIRGLTETLKSVQNMDLRELLSKYAPNSLDGQISPITGELVSRVQKQLGRNPSVVVFNADGSVDVTVTLQLLEDAFKGFPDIARTPGNPPRRTFRFGESSGDIYDINPLTGKILRSSGIDDNGFNWKQVPIAERQMIYFARRSGEIPSTTSTIERTMILQIASGENGLAQLQAMFPQAAETYLDRQDLGTLPPLRRRAESANPQDSRRMERVFSED